MAGFSPACAAPACSLLIPPPPSTAFEDFLRSGDRAGRFIVEFRAFPRAAAPTAYPALPACAAPACALGEPIGTPATETTVTLSDHPFRTGPTDPLRPNLSAEARLARRVDIDVAFSVVPNTAAAAQQLAGDIEVENADKWADPYVTDFAVDGRLIRIRFGPEDGEYGDFRIVEETFGKDWRGDEERIRLTVQDLQFRLDQQFQTASYRGTGGIEGDAALAGQLKPRLFGYRFHFTPKLISASQSIYQMSEFPVENVLSVRDGGAAYTFNSDVTTYNALAALTLPEGHYATARNLGLLRIHPAGGSLASVLGVEARGYNVGGYVEGAGDILVRILRDLAGINDTEIDPGSFAPLNAYLTGYYYDGTNESLTFRQVVQELTVQTNGRIISDSRIRAARIIDPNSATFNYTLDPEQIEGVEPEGVIYQPIYRTVVEYRPNDAVLTADDVVDPGTDAAAKFERQLAIREIERRNGSVILRHVGALREMRLTTNLADEASAVALADAISTLWNTERITYRIVANREAMFFAVGTIVRINYPRYHFAGGRNALIISKRNDYNRQQAEFRVLI